MIICHLLRTVQDSHSLQTKAVLFLHCTIPSMQEELISLYSMHTHHMITHVKFLLVLIFFFFGFELLLNGFFLSLAADQYIWLENDLRNTNRSETPWVVATWSLPWYSTFRGHYREGESMRINLEDLLYSYQVDIVFNSQVRF